MALFVEVLKALGPFAWPIVIGLAIWKFRIELSNLLAALPDVLSRVKSAEVPGFKFDMNAQERVTAEAQSEVVERNNLPRIFLEPPAPPTPAPASAIEQIRDLAAQSTRAALALCERYIEKEIRQIMATMGLFDEYTVPPQATLTLEQRGILPTRVRQAVNGFLSLADGATPHICLTVRLGLYSRMA